MGSSKTQKNAYSNQRPRSQDRLLQKMSEVISLREKVAQAELMAHIFGAPLDYKVAEPEK